MAITWGKCGHPLRGRRPSDEWRPGGVVNGCRLCWLVRSDGPGHDDAFAYDSASWSDGFYGRYDARGDAREEWVGREDEANACAGPEVWGHLGDLDEVRGSFRDPATENERIVAALLASGDMRLMEWQRGAEFIRVPEVAFVARERLRYDPATGRPRDSVYMRPFPRSGRAVAHQIELETERALRRLDTRCVAFLLPAARDLADVRIEDMRACSLQAGHEGPHDFTRRPF